MERKEADKESDEKILKKLRRLEKKIKRRQSVNVSNPDDPILKLNNENRLNDRQQFDNFCAHDTTYNDDLKSISSSKDDANGQESNEQPQSTSQVPDTESEVMKVMSTPSGKKSDEVNKDTVVETKQLDEEIKKVLGEDPESEKQKDIDLHPDLLALRDNLFFQEQNFAGTALAALGEAITMILKDEEEPIDRMKLLERLADTGDFLYGDKLGEVIKSAKSVEKIRKEIKVQKASVPSTVSKKPNFKYTRRTLNWRGPYSRLETSNQGYKTSQTSSKFSKNQQYNKLKQIPLAK